MRPNISKLDELDSGDVLWYGTRYVVWTLLILMIVVPLLYIISVAFRPPTELYEPHFIPHEFTTEGLMAAWKSVKRESRELASYR